jgi:hypothetical protein
MRRILLTLAVLAVVGAPAIATSKPEWPTEHLQQSSAAEKKKFSWEGSCEVKCTDGSCKVVCGGGIVYGNSEFEARLQAEASLRQQAGSQGIVKEGSIRLTVRGGF